MAHGVEFSDLIAVAQCTTPSSGEDDQEKSLNSSCELQRVLICLTDGNLHVNETLARNLGAAKLSKQLVRQDR